MVNELGSRASSARASSEAPLPITFFTDDSSEGAGVNERQVEDKLDYPNELAEQLDLRYSDVHVVGARTLQDIEFARQEVANGAREIEDDNDNEFYEFIEGMVDNAVPGVDDQDERYHVVQRQQGEFRKVLLANDERYSKIVDELVVREARYRGKELPKSERRIQLGEKAKGFASSVKDGAKKSGEFVSERTKKFLGRWNKTKKLDQQHDGLVGDFANDGISVRDLALIGSIFDGTNRKVDDDKKVIPGTKLDSPREKAEQIASQIIGQRELDEDLDEEAKKRYHLELSMRILGYCLKDTEERVSVRDNLSEREKNADGSEGETKLDRTKRLLGKVATKDSVSKLSPRAVYAKIDAYRVNRSAQKQESFAAMSSDERVAYYEKRKRNTALGAVGAFATVAGVTTLAYLYGHDTSSHTDLLSSGVPRKGRFDGWLAEQSNQLQLNQNGSNGHALDGNFLTDTIDKIGSSIDIDTADTTKNGDTSSSRFPIDFFNQAGDSVKDATDHAQDIADRVTMDRKSGTGSGSGLGTPRFGQFADKSGGGVLMKNSGANPTLWYNHQKEFADKFPDLTYTMPDGNIGLLDQDPTTKISKMPKAAQEFWKRLNN